MQFLKDVSKRKGENSLWFPYKYAYCTFVDVGIGIGGVPCRPVGEGDGAIVISFLPPVSAESGVVGGRVFMSFTSLPPSYYLLYIYPFRSGSSLSFRR